MLRYLIFTVLLLSTSAPLSAKDLGINLGLFRYSHTEGVSTSSGEREDENIYTFYTGGICYSIADEVCGGFKYSKGEKTTKSTTKSGGTTVSSSKLEKDWTGMGLSIGWRGKAFSAVATYFLSAVRNDKSGSSTQEYSGGSGYQIDLGYGFKVNGDWSLGPMLSLFHLDYKEVKENGTSTELDYTLKDEFLMPAIALWTSF